MKGYLSALEGNVVDAALIEKVSRDFSAKIKECVDVNADKQAEQTYEVQNIPNLDDLIKKFKEQEIFKDKQPQQWPNYPIWPIFPDVAYPPLPRNPPTYQPIITCNTADMGGISETNNVNTTKQRTSDQPNSGYSNE